MPRDQNFLLGHGERLAANVHIQRGGRTKHPPYTFGEALTRLTPRVADLSAAIDALPELACPRDEAVAVITMHPRYVAKSEFPSTLLQAARLRAVGSRTRSIVPQNWGIVEHPDAGLAEDIFVAGSRTAFRTWAATFVDWNDLQPRQAAWSELRAVEEVAFPTAAAKLRGQIPAGTDLLEVVLHNSGSQAVLTGFLDFLGQLDAEPILESKRDVGGLTFIPVRPGDAAAIEIAEYAFVRIARAMPRLRPIRPIRRQATAADVVLPDADARSADLRTVIFDGGLPPDAATALARWVTLTDAPDVGDADEGYLDHGLAVTGSFLFGPLDGAPPAVPWSNVEHVRVLDIHTDDPSDPAAYKVLDRIVNHIEQSAEPIDLINISVGPSTAVDDDDVSLWTSRLDELLADGRTVTSVAAGNDGDLDRASGLHRVQPPADGVNVLSVGASDVLTDPWARAPYSSMGPGRCPGIVKPDGVAFGGTTATPFPIVDRDMKIAYDTGTSYAAPFALRAAASVVAQVGDRIGRLATRALMIHRADADGNDWREVGWGRFELDDIQLITCEDHESVVVYQGYLPVGEHLRVPIAMPDVALRGRVTITATLAIAPEVDAAHAATHTRSGLEVVFRPNSRRFNMVNGRPRQNPRSRPFFTVARMYTDARAVLREDGEKWEPCLKNSERLDSRSLFEPAFDIYYHHRVDAGRAANPQPIPYAFVVSLSSPANPDLYAGVIRAHANILEQVRPVNQIQVQA